MEYCIVCYEDVKDIQKLVLCSNKHIVCKECYKTLRRNKKPYQCPYCRELVQHPKDTINIQYLENGDILYMKIKDLSKDVREIWKNEIVLYSIRYLFEVSGKKWLPVDEVENQLTFKDTKALWQKAKEKIGRLKTND